ncbi:MAG: hypothetical protein CMI54_07540 [Parcubacteria group bacterium]|nr:hypothetical protein [Parcubacteria group bacterium]|tara:strand:- start:9193 stop:10035 length:843 start_codon:yes stop_codon:yes gene_type:complete
MKAHWENKIMSSIMLYIDHAACKDGEGFINHQGLFYKTQKQYNQFYTYSLPFKQIVADTSVTSANVLQGVYINNDFKIVGQDGLQGILHHKGTVLFDQDHDSDSILGNYAVKEFNVYITTKAEEDLLFKTAKQVNPKIAQVQEGLDPNTEAYPAIFLKNNGGHAEPLAFGGLHDTISYVRAVILAESAFNLDAVCGLLKSKSKQKLPILENLPFNAIGAFTGITYDYENLVLQSEKAACIWDVRVSKIMPRQAGLQELTLDAHAAFVDFEIHAFAADFEA